MTKKKTSLANNARKVIASPEAILTAAEKAPVVFNIAAYFQPIYIMREKGHSWRDLAVWLKQFIIEISHVHLRRLYVQEDIRLSKLTERELRELGISRERIAEYMEKKDPTKRLPAPDPDDEDSQ